MREGRSEYLGTSCRRNISWMCRSVCVVVLSGVFKLTVMSGSVDEHPLYSNPFSGMGHVRNGSELSTQKGEKSVEGKVATR